MFTNALKLLFPKKTAAGWRRKRRDAREIWSISLFFVKAVGGFIRLFLPISLHSIRAEE